MLCTSGFMDDVTFGRNGRDAETWQPNYHREATTTSGVAIAGQSLMSMKAFSPSRDAEYCDQPVCLCVCVCVCVCPSANISLEPLNRSSRNFVCRSLWPWLGPPLSALRYVMYFRFMDDVTFGRNGRDAETWRPHRAATTTNGVAIPRDRV